VHRAFRIALRAPDEYALFLSLGLGTLIALEMLLISGGVLGAIPLSGVVSPFLSSGNTAMLANFFVFAILAGISNQPVRSASGGGLNPAFGIPVRTLTVVLGALAVSLAGRAAWLQVLHADDLMVRDARVIEDDGVKRPQVNPRLTSIARAIPRGTVYDRTGLPLATSSWEDLEQHRADYQKLGISIDQACSRLERRHYPLGAATSHLLGDLRTRENFHASNASLIEHDLNPRLQGFSDLHELAAFVRHRHQPGHQEMEALLARDRNVRSTIDAGLQLRLNELLRTQLEPSGKSGAAVAMDAATGELLALGSFPTPAAGAPSTPDQLLDRARYGQYPPGSTFKLVTAIAALRRDPGLEKKKYECRRLRDGRVGTMIPGWNRPIRDDIGDHAHGSLAMGQALAISCNAYFAQLGTYDVGASSLHDTGELLGIPAGDVGAIRKMMPFSSYGQGPVLATPFKMARVAALIAEGGNMAQGVWVKADRNEQPRRILAAAQAQFLAEAMRSVVTSGTGRRAMAGLDVEVAGKTGTAQVDEGAPHSWFVGFAPYNAQADHRIAFAVVVEHGGYGSQFAAPIARQIVEAARDLGIVTAKR
jgi:cell division protein FtsI/penicillin-binding protein 2